MLALSPVRPEPSSPGTRALGSWGRPGAGLQASPLRSTGGAPGYSCRPRPLGGSRHRCSVALAQMSGSLGTPSGDWDSLAPPPLSGLCRPALGQPGLPHQCAGWAPRVAPAPSPAPTSWGPGSWTCGVGHGGLTLVVLAAAWAPGIPDIASEEGAIRRAGGSDVHRGHDFGEWPEAASCPLHPGVRPSRCPQAETDAGRGRPAVPAATHATEALPAAGGSSP